MDNKTNPFLGSELFWEGIHKYLKDRPIEVEKVRRSRQKAPTKRQCPACQKDMEVIEFNEVLLDRCPCGGIFLDSGELELLFKTQQESGFIPSLKRFFAP